MQKGGLSDFGRLGKLVPPTVLELQFGVCSILIISQ